MLATDLQKPLSLRLWVLKLTVGGGVNSVVWVLGFTGLRGLWSIQ